MNLSTKRSRDVTTYADALHKDVEMLQQKLAMEQDMNNELKQEIQECRFNLKWPMQQYLSKNFVKSVMDQDDSLGLFCLGAHH